MGVGRAGRIDQRRVALNEDVGELEEGLGGAGTIVLHDVGVAPVVEDEELVELVRNADSPFLRRGENEVTMGGSDQPATEKQLGFLKSLGIKVESGLTKQQASALIDEAQK